MTAAGISAAGPGGVLRLTWVRDRLAHSWSTAIPTSHPARGRAWPAPITA